MKEIRAVTTRNARNHAMGEGTCRVRIRSFTLCFIAVQMSTYLVLCLLLTKVSVQDTIPFRQMDHGTYLTVKVSNLKRKSTIKVQMYDAFLQS